MNRYLVIVVSLALVSGCKQNMTEPLQSLIVDTDKSSYAPNETVAISLHNGSTLTAYFGHCDYRIGFCIEQKVNGSWSEKGSIALVCLAIYPVGVKAITPGTIITDWITIADSGIYRLKYPFGWRQSEMSAHSLLSNEFSVR